LKQFKEALAELLNWNKTHPEDVANQYKQWRAKNSIGSFQFVNQWILKHWAEDHDLTILVRDAEMWLKHYPSKK